MTGFANVEEEASNNAAGMTVQPWRIEDAARERGANYVEGGVWKPFAVRDGRLITGQQQYSGTKVAELVIQALGR
jgi:putative intracellular protease/amidase